VHQYVAGFFTMFKALRHTALGGTTGPRSPSPSSTASRCRATRSGSISSTSIRPRWRDRWGE
jgi:hypothetical protein